MRVTHVIPGLVTESSGPTYSVVRLVRELKHQAIASRIATLDYRSSVVEDSAIVRFPISLGMQHLGLSTEMHKWLRAEAGLRGLDIMHSHGLWMMPNVYAGWTTRGTRIPLVVSPRGCMSDWAMRHGSLAKPMFWNVVQRRAIAHARLFHATSHEEASQIRRLGFKAPIAVIPNGVDLPLHAAHASAKSRTIAFLGRLHPVKGIEDLMRAWRACEANHPDWTLLIAGPDRTPYARRLKALAADLKIERVRFLGELSGDAKFEFLADASVFVLPSRSENFAMAVAESLACGTCAIVTHGAPWSGLATNQAGWWIEAGTDSLRATLEKAMRTPAERLNEMGEAGRAWMKRDFAWPRIGEMFEGTYRWLLDGGSPPPWVRID